MSEWFNFALYVLKELVSMVFGWELGLGFSFGDFVLACMVVSIVVSALVVKSSHISSGDSKFNIPIGRGSKDE